VILTNLGYPGNAAAGTAVSSGQVVSSGGLIGPTGTTGATAATGTSNSGVAWYLAIATPYKPAKGAGEYRALVVGPRRQPRRLGEPGERGPSAVMGAPVGAERGSGASVSRSGTERAR